MADSYCTSVPHAGDQLTAPCPDCGHAVVLHIGVDHCPVCELVDLNERVRAASGPVEVHVQVQGDALTEKQLLDAIHKGQHPH